MRKLLDVNFWWKLTGLIPHMFFVVIMLLALLLSFSLGPVHIIVTILILCNFGPNLIREIKKEWENN